MTLGLVVACTAAASAQLLHHYVTGVAAAAGQQACVYRANGALPDSLCTPGVVAKGYTTRRLCAHHYPPRPPVTVTEPMKRKAMAEYGYVYGTSARAYEYDHLVPLELGGAPADPRNLWPEPHAGPNGSYTKDGVENHLRAQLCAGKITLRAARHIMRTDWRLGLHH